MSKIGESRHMRDVFVRNRLLMKTKCSFEVLRSSGGLELWEGTRSKIERISFSENSKLLEKMYQI